MNESFNYSSSNELTKEETEKLSYEYETIFNGTQDAIFLIDIDLENRFVYRRINKAHERATGLTTEYLKGKTPCEVFGKQLGRRIEESYNQCVSAKHIIDYEETLEFPAGEKTWHTILTPIVKDDRVIHIVGSRRDITEARQKEKELHESEERYKNLFINNHAVMLIVDSETGTVVNANPAACDFYGYSKTQLIGMNISDINILTQQQIYEEMELAKAQRRKHFNFRHRLSDGEIRDVEVYSGPISFKEKRYLYSIIHDVTERKLAEERLESVNSLLINKQYELEEQNAIVEELNAQLEEENEKYEQQRDTLQGITYSIEEGIAMIDKLSKTVFVNRAWKEFFGCKSDMNSTDMSIEAEVFIARIASSVKNGQEVLIELQGLLENHMDEYTTELEQIEPIHRYLNLYSVPCTARDGRILGRIFVCRDISQEKEVDQLKSELISTVSHELRTPMSSIMGFSELLLTRELPPELSKEYVKIIHSESERLTKLINDFLDIQKMESGRQIFEKKNVSFDEVIKESVKLFHNIGDQHRIIFDNSRSLPVVYCDHDKMIQVMSNLISNAIKYSPDGGDIIIHTDIKEGMLKVCVTDHGLGIPEKEQKKLFTKFFRVDNDDRRKIGGTGLGLAICKQIVQAHGGKIWAHSTYGEGSSFCFNIPLIEESYIEATAYQQSINPNGSDTILIVEDDQNLIRFIRDVLEHGGYEVYAAYTGEEAVRLIEKIPFKAIILDVVLIGEMNGWDVLKAIKNNPQRANTPVIISSIYENEDPSITKEVTDYLVKPFDPQRLLDIIHKVEHKGMESKMMMQIDEKIEREILNILDGRGIQVKSIQRKGDIMIMTLDGEKNNETE